MGDDGPQHEGPEGTPLGEGGILTDAEVDGITGGEPDGPPLDYEEDHGFF